MSKEKEKIKGLKESAFPYTADLGNGASFQAFGMTLRDYFAAKVMQELVSLYQDKWEIHRKDKLAEEAYLMADIMLKERSKP